MIGNRKDIINFLLDFTDDEVFEIKEHFVKRSKDANGYCWVLCGKLAKVLNSTKEEVYRKHIREMETFEYSLMKCEAVVPFEKLWVDNHIGRFVDSKDSHIAGYSNVFAYYGSSDYSKSEMARLLDNIIDECNEQRIETLTPAEVERMKEAWR